MVRTVQHRPAPSTSAGIFGKIKQHLVMKTEAEILKKRAETLRDDIMAYIEDHGEADEKGSLNLVLPDVISVHGKEFRSVKRERRVSTHFDEMAAETLLTVKNILPLAQRSVVTIRSDLPVETAFTCVDDVVSIYGRMPTHVCEDARIEWSTYIDQNEIYVLNQKGLITNEELDNLFVENISYAYKTLSS